MGRPALVRLNECLFQLSLRGLGILNYEDTTISGERWLVERLLPVLVVTPEPVFLDVGANRGEYTALLRSKFPNAKIYAFEPHPITFARLAQRADRGTYCKNYAISNRVGTTLLYDRDDWEGSPHASLYPEVISRVHKQNVVEHEVRLTTLDLVAEELDLPYVDFIKIDTEGHERAVLEGAQRLLAECRIGCMQFEFNEMHVVSRCFLSDLRGMLQDFALFRLLPHGLLKLDERAITSEQFAFQNIVAVRLAMVDRIRKA